MSHKKGGNSAPIRINYSTLNFSILSLSNNALKNISHSLLAIPTFLNISHSSSAQRITSLLPQRNFFFKHLIIINWRKELTRVLSKFRVPRRRLSNWGGEEESSEQVLASSSSLLSSSSLF